MIGNVSRCSPDPFSVAKRIAPWSPCPTAIRTATNVSASASTWTAGASKKSSAASNPTRSPSPPAIGLEPPMACQPSAPCAKSKVAFVAAAGTASSAIRIDSSANCVPSCTSRRNRTIFASGCQNGRTEYVRHCPSPRTLNRVVFSCVNPPKRPWLVLLQNHSHSPSRSAFNRTSTTCHGDARNSSGPVRTNIGSCPTARADKTPFEAVTPCKWPFGCQPCKSPACSKDHRTRVFAGGSGADSGPAAKAGRANATAKRAGST